MPTFHEIQVQAFLFWLGYGRPSEEVMSSVKIWFEAQNYLYEIATGVS
jgi:hypothetical protein